MSGAGPTHPKNALYDEVYEPLTVAWFDELGHSQRRAGLLAEAPHRSLLDNLNELNKLLHHLVDTCLEALGGKADDMVAVVSHNREHVLWEGQMTPEADATAEEIKAAFSNKIKRNISMGAVEIAICLEAATAFGKDRLGLSGASLARVLKHSGQLCGSLALLHDAQEQHRLQALTGEDEYLKYPDVTFADVVEGGRYRIPAGMLVAVGSGDDLRLKFVGIRARPGPFDTPIRRCPAYVSHKGSERSPILNDILWSLIVDIYDRSGRFA